MAEQLKTLLEPEFEVVATVGDGVALVEAAGTLEPDVIITDIMMPRLDGIEAAAAIIHRNPSARIVIVSIYADRETTRAGLAAGALGYVLKDTAAEDLPAAVRAALRGERYLSEPLRRWVPVKEAC